MTEKPDQVTDEIYEMAASWYLKIEFGDVDHASEEFWEWIHADQQHLAAYRAVSDSWTSVGEFAAEPEIVVARSEALSEGIRTSRRRWVPWGPRIEFRAMAGALAVALVVAASGVLFLSQKSDPISQTYASSIYETAAGETRTITLSDHSKIALDAMTRVEVAYTKEERDVTLISGQAHFVVAKESARPFQVAVKDQVVVATGTEFNVELLDQDVLVTLIEGQVVVGDSDSAREFVQRDWQSGKVDADTANNPDTYVLKAGQQFVAMKDERPKLAELSVLENVTAWQHGKVVLEDEPLSIAVMRMNRYSRVQIQLKDASVNAFSVSGVFNAGDTKAFVEALKAYFPIEIDHESSSSIVLARRD